MDLEAIYSITSSLNFSLWGPSKGWARNWRKCNLEMLALCSLLQRWQNLCVDQYLFERQSLQNCWSFVRADWYSLYIALFFPLFLPSMEALKDVVALIWKKSQSQSSRCQKHKWPDLETKVDHQSIVYDILSRFQRPQISDSYFRLWGFLDVFFLLLLTPHLKWILGSIQWTKTFGPKKLRCR